MYPIAQLHGIMTDQLLDIIAAALDEARAAIHTATVARITSVGATAIDCQPVIDVLVDGASVRLPVFSEVPPLFLQGGSSYTAHPLAVGDYCLLIITERCFDRWYHGQDGLPPLSLRAHDYSDAIAIVGLNPLASALTIPSVIQQTGDTNYDGDHTHQGTLDRVGDTAIEGDVYIDGNVTITGNLTVQGTIAAGNFTGLGGGSLTATVDIVSQGKSLQHHTHYVPAAPGESSQPS